VGAPARRACIPTESASLGRPGAGRAVLQSDPMTFRIAISLALLL